MKIERLPRATRALASRLAQEAHGMMSRVWRTTVGLPSSRDEPSPGAVRLAEIRRQANAVLADNILPFWVSHAWDDTHGGFITHLDRVGRRLGPTDKYLVPQARLVWTLAAAHRHGLTGKGYLERADQGARFLVDRMWDADAGGFVWAVRQDGTPLARSKSTYGQAFAIYGLAEYALAARSQWARDWAVRGFDTLVERAGDGELGFQEELDPDWRPGPSLVGHGKTVNVHLHVMEAFTTLVEMTGDARHAARLRSVLDLLLTRGIVARHPYAYAIDRRLDREWRGATRWRWPVGVTYGHGAELAWLCQRAVDVLGDPPDRIRALGLALVDHALDFGFDQRRGGVARGGPPLGHARLAWYLPAAYRTKHWWEQAEMLVATLVAHEWSGEPRYLAAFARQFEWVWTHQIDHAGGDWFEATAWRDGRPLSLVKGHEWKDPYHGARALMEISRGLSRLLDDGAPSARGTSPGRSDTLVP